MPQVHTQLISRINEEIRILIGNRRGIIYGLHSSSGSDRYHGHHRYHPYRRNDRGYFSDEFKNSKPPTFDGEEKNA